MRHKNGFKKHAAAIFLFITLILICAPATLHASTCNPSSAILCAAVDDVSDFYVNGNYITTLIYCDISWACTPVCVTLNSTQMNALTDSNNLIAVYDQNTNCCEVWASWSLEITCGSGSMSGQHVIVSSDNRPVSMHYDTNCMCGSMPCSTPNPSPTPPGSYQWYNPLYVETPSAWTAPINMTGPKNGKRIYDPSTGNLLNTLSYISAMSTGCGALWFREGFSMQTPNPTPAPPNFTIVKSANQSNIGSDSHRPWILTFTYTVCNTGGGTFGNPMQVTDHWDSTDNLWQFQGPDYGPDYTPQTNGIVNITHSDPNITWNFVSGLGSGECFTYTYWLENWNTISYCYTWHNNVQAEYPPGAPVAYSTVNLIDFCPSSTITPTITPTSTKTFTATPTITPSPSSTRTPSPSPSITPTRTPSPTSSVSPTATMTPSPTYTITVSPTYTITPSPSPQPSMQITKTANVSTATFGDIITWTLTYKNIGSATANPVCLYDTVPAAITYINSSVAPTSGPPNLMWCIGSVGPGGSGSITWWGQITSYPFDPFFHMHFYFAEVDENPMVRVSGFPDLWDRERVNGILLE